MKTYVLLIAKHFMATHPKAGQPTLFNFKIMKNEKIHTIRGNYEFWKKRVDEINAGRAILSVREWSLKPYRSPQRELRTFDKLGIQKLEWTYLGWFVDSLESDLKIKDLANNDGLLLEDFNSWFSKAGDEEMAIIHFTDFRY